LTDEIIAPAISTIEYKLAFIVVLFFKFLFISLFHYKFHYRIALTGNVESWLPSCGRNLCRNSVGDHLTHHVANHDA